MTRKPDPRCLGLDHHVNDEELVEVQTQLAPSTMRPGYKAVTVNVTHGQYATLHRLAEAKTTSISQLLREWLQAVLDNGGLR